MCEWYEVVGFLMTALLWTTFQRFLHCLQVDLSFKLQEDVTTVHTKLAVEPNYKENGAAPPLLLDGARPDANGTH